MPRCDKGHEAKEVKGAMLDGKFGRYCPPHIQQSSRAATGQSAQWHRARDAEQHRRDMIQPKGTDGQINPEFVRNYPEESAEMFTQADIEKTMRNV
jgi:hypothetical protein